MINKENNRLLFVFTHIEELSTLKSVLGLFGLLLVVFIIGLN